MQRAGELYGQRERELYSQRTGKLYRQRALTDNSPRSKFKHFFWYNHRNVIRLGIAAAFY